MPVSTSPVPAVASDGGPARPRARPRPARRRACRRPSAGRRSRTARRRAAAPRADGPRPSSTARRAGARARPRAASGPSEPSARPARGRAARPRRRRPAGRPRRAACRTSSSLPRAEARAERERASPAPPRRTPRRAALHRLEQPRLEHRERLGGCGDGDVAGVGAKRRLGGQARGARSSRARRRRRAPSRRCTCCRLPCGAARCRRTSRVTRRCSVSRGLEADVGDRHARRRGTGRVRRRARPSSRGTSTV